MWKGETQEGCGQAVMLHKVANVCSEMGMKHGGGSVSSCEDAPGLRVSMMRSIQSKAGSVLCV